MKRFIKRVISVLVNNFKLCRLKHFGKRSYIGKGLTINGKRKELITIEDNVSIGRFARLGNTFNQGTGITIGSNTSIANYFTAVDGEITVGNNVLMASGVAIFAGNHVADPMLERGYSNGKMDFASVVIGDDCWIGEKCIILPGVTVGEFAIIGAGSVVTKDIPPYSMAVGNPARVIKKYNKDTNTWERVYERELVL